MDLGQYNMYNLELGPRHVKAGKHKYVGTQHKLLKPAWLSDLELRQSPQSQGHSILSCPCVGKRKLGCVSHL